jgi:hypothetical protein
MSIWPFKTNFSLIAENTTKYYMELKCRYKERFTDDAALLAAAGILDAQNYIFPSPPQIDIVDVIELAQKCTVKDEDYIPMRRLIRYHHYEEKRHRSRDYKSYLVDLLDSENLTESSECTDEVFDFVFGLELLLFKVENKKFSPHAIEEACRSKYKTIEKAITQTIKKYEVGRGMLARATTAFMENASLEPLRTSLGILP